MAIIEFKNVTFGYTRDEKVIEDITFSVKKGEYLGIIGPNGSGKTTVIKLLLGILSPQEGMIRVFKKDRDNFKDSYKIGYVPQQTAYAKSFPATVKEIIQSGRIAKNGLWQPWTQEDGKAVQKAIHTTGLKKVQNKLLSELSGGQRQRTLIARALASDPKILVLDEPSTGVDIKSQETFFDFLKTLNKKMGLTIILVSHDMDVITKEANKVLCINKKLVCNAPIKEFVKGDYLKDLYGENVKYVKHKHH